MDEECTDAVGQECVQFVLTAATSAADAGIREKNIRTRNNNANYVKPRNKRHYHNSLVSRKLMPVSKRCYTSNRK